MVGKIIAGLMKAGMRAGWTASKEVEPFTKPAIKKPFFFTVTPKPDPQKLKVKWMTAAEVDALAQKNLVERLKAIKEQSKSK